MNGAVSFGQLGNGSIHGFGMERGASELRKERALAKEAKHIGELEDLVHQLQQDLESLEAEASRLRKQNEDLSRRIQTEADEHAEVASRWLEKEQDLLKAVRTEKSKNKELKEIVEAKSAELHQLSVKSSSSSSSVSEYSSSTYSDDDEPVRRTSSPPPRTTFEVQEENARLRSQLQDLTSRLAARESQIRRQDQEIVELQRTVSALMDELESGYDQAMFGFVNPDVLSGSDPGSGSLDEELAALSMKDSRVRSMSEASVQGRSLFDELSKVGTAASSNEKPSHDTTPPVDAATSSTEPIPSSNSTSIIDTLEQQSASKSNSSSDNEGSSSPTGSSGFADELNQLGEMKFNFATSRGEPGSLRSRLAALGLNTDGNRRILKKRLQVYIKRKQAALQRQQENGGSMYGALSPTATRPPNGGLGYFGAATSPTTQGPGGGGSSLSTLKTLQAIANAPILSSAPPGSKRHPDVDPPGETAPSPSPPLPAQSVKVH
ncbi:hypothetical protein HK102_005228 [Quaeritorhiza haematococci]|nr:hypothetical protein HK102_005228 [Quaeritorhiza haematococci]